MNTWFRRILAWPWRRKRLPTRWLIRQHDRNATPGRCVRHYTPRKDNP